MKCDAIESILATHRLCQGLESDHELEKTVGLFAYQTINQQFHYIVAQQEGVIADEDPEFLHQMRVGFRRFQSAIAVFSPVLRAKIDLQSGKKVLKKLGRLRDLDVQLQRIRSKRQLAKTPGAKRSLICLRRDLSQKRRKVYQRVNQMLMRQSDYQSFKRSVHAWLEEPQFEAIAQLPIGYCAPELLSPIVSRLLLHPAWLLSETAMIDEPAFHDLRKLCKQVRYQGEFFLPLYPQAFKGWIKEIKSIQSGLGQLQDAYVSRCIIRKYQPGSSVEMMQEHIDEFRIMQEWEPLRQQYLDPQYRRSLHLLLWKCDQISGH